MAGIFRASRLGAGLILAAGGLLPAPAIDPPAAAQTLSTLPDIYAGLPPAEARSLRESLSRLTRERDVREATLVAIAARLRVDYSQTSFATLLEALDARATEAEALRIELASLRGKFAAIPVQADRGHAERLLAEARAAFDAGDLDRADRLLAELTPLRGEALRVGLDNWQAVVEARAAVMVVSGKVAESVDYRRLASRALSELTRQKQFQIMLKAAEDAFEEGRRLPGLDLLRLAADTYENDVLPLAPRERAPVDWAMTQANLGIALRTQGERVGAEAGTALLARAVDASKAALTVYTKDAMPAEWAMTQNNLGNALQTQGERTGGEAGRTLLSLAVEAYEAALTVQTKDTMPADWAMTQNNLGSALQTQGGWPEDQAETALLARAVEAYEAALTVRTKDAMPADWAATQNNLGNALGTQGMRTEGETGTALLARAVKAYEAALTIYTRDTTPAAWATTQANLGGVLATQGERTGGEAGTTLLVRAVESYEAVLTVYTRDAMPTGWATTQVNFGLARLSIAQLAADQAGWARGARQALDHFQNALAVFGDDHTYSRPLANEIARIETLLSEGRRE